MSQFPRGSAFFVRPHDTSMTSVLLLPFVVLAVGIALLVGGERTKDKAAGAVLRVIGVLAIILSLVFIGGCLMVARGLHGLM